jgi:hypothetical protein
MVMFTMILIMIVLEHMRNSAHEIETARKKETESSALEGRIMDINNVLGNQRKPEQPIELLIDDDVLVKEKAGLAAWHFDWRGTSC